MQSLVNKCKTETLECSVFSNLSKEILTEVQELLENTSFNLRRNAENSNKTVATIIKESLQNSPKK